MFFDTTGSLVTSIWGDVSGTATQGGTGGGSAIPQNTWTHVGFAIANTASVYKTYIYVNGTPTAYTPPAGWVPKFYAGGATQIGGRNNSSDLTNMYIRDLRVVQGGVVPVATFTPGAAPFSYASPTYVANMGTTVFTLLGQFVTYVPGKYNQAISFQGYGLSSAASTSNVVYTFSSTVPINPGITVSFWINYSYNNSTSGQPANPLIVYASGFLPNSIRVGLVPSNKILIQYYYGGFGGSSTYLLSSTTLSPGTWYHVCTIIDTSPTNYLYMNGSLSASGSVASGYNDSLTGAILGAGGTNAQFNGLIDDLRIYNTALTAAQVQSVYSSQGAPAPSLAMPLPKLAWDFNGTTAPYIGTATGTTTGTISYTNGKYGQSLVITNTAGVIASNYVSYTTPYYPSTLTTAVWLKLNTIGVASQYFLEFGGTSGGISYVIFINSDNTVAFRVQAQGGVATTISTVSTVTSGQWYHIAAVIDGYNQTIYLNGVIASGPSPCNTLAFQYLNLVLGGSTDVPRVLVNGSIDDLRIFDRALTSIQVNDIYNQQGMPGRGVVGSNNRAPGSTAIYSTNWVNPSYSGAIVNVERASDGAVSDFYVDTSGNFTQSSGTSLTSWLGGAQANVLIWYDQSGAGLNAIKDNTTIYGRAPQLVVDPAGSGKYVIYFPNQNSSVTNYYGFRISAQTTASMMCRFYVKSGKIGDANWQSFLSANADKSVRLVNLNLPTGDGNDFLNPGGFAIYDGTYKNTTPYLTATLDSWHTMMASRVSGSMSMEFIGRNFFQDRSLYGYMTDMVTFTASTGPSAYSAYFASPVTTLTGTPLFNQLSQSATSSAVGAFSLRAVNGITARAVNVRNGTTSATQDFYADERGNLLTAPVVGQTLANWLGGATGYVTTWYNQIQPGQDVSATVAANQPTIDPVNKTIVFNGSTHSFSNTATTGGLLAACVGTGTKYTYVASWNKTNGSNGRVCEHNASSFTNNQCSALIASGNQYGFNGESNDNGGLAPMTLGTQVSTVMRLDNTNSTNLRVRSNGTNYSGSTSNYTTLSLNNFWFVIGRKASNNSEFFTGTIKNVMVFKDAISDADTAVLDTWQQSL
jgi:hypothetical protein